MPFLRKFQATASDCNLSLIADVLEICLHLVNAVSALILVTISLCPLFRRGPALFYTTILCLSVCLESRVLAESMDPALEGLVENAGCQTVAGESCIGDQRAFRGLVNQYGAVIAPSGFMPANTTGHGGFEILYEGNLTKVDQNSAALRLGTRGKEVKSSTNSAYKNESPRSIMQLHSLRIRKGLGLGLEASAQVGLLGQTSIMVAGGDLRFSLFEGFRDGILGYIPDFAVASAGRTIAGASDLRLSVFDLRGTISKEFTGMGASVVTPILGYQYLWIRGESRVIDFTPGIDALGECQYTGDNQPGTIDSTGVDDGSPVCSESGNADDFANLSRFETERLTRQRLFMGLNYQYEYLVVGGQLLFDLVSPSRQNSGLLDGALNQWGLSFQLGARF